MAENHRSSLWQHPDFMRLWTSETISLVGSQITFLAIPLTAANMLQATPEQMGLLNSLGFLPFLLIGLFAGVWVDRMRRRPVLMSANIGRAILLATIPAAALLHVLRMEQLYIVSFLVGILTVFFDVAYQSYLPTLVGRADIVEGNSKLELSRSITQVAGPGMAGLLIQIFTAPITIALDAISFLISFFFLSRIQKQEQKQKNTENRHMLHEIREGMGVVLKNPMLRSIAACTATSNLFANVVQAVFILYATRNLNLSEAAVGLIFGLASIGGLLGAVIASRIVRRIGLGMTIIGGIFLVGVAYLFMPLAGGSLLTTVPFILLAQFIGAFGGTIYNINQLSLRQTITPHHLLGRMNASMRFIVWGTIPIGSLIGGFLGGSIGLRETIIVGALGALLAPLWIFFSPVRGLLVQPEPVEETA